MKTAVYTPEAKKEIANYIATALREGRGEDQYGCDLHGHLLNSDPYFVYTNDAKEWIDTMFGSSFDAIGFVKEYEEFQYGECYVDYTNPTHVANMCVYIIGEDVLAETSLSDDWDSYIKDETIEEMIAELDMIGA